MAQHPGHQVVWFDIPVHDLDRAIRFYSAVLGGTIKREDFGGLAIGVLPHEGDTVGGCLYHKPGDQPSRHGPLLYLNAQGRLDDAVGAVEKNGGKVLEQKQSIAPHGFRAVVLDSEGNRIALHSM
jgi:predicted enzyme related to lactoylglutathione lyase